MASRKAPEFTERIKDSWFTRQVLGPKVARPLAAWLEDTFVDGETATAAATMPDSPEEIASP